MDTGAGVGLKLNKRRLEGIDDVREQDMGVKAHNHDQYSWIIRMRLGSVRDIT